MQTFIVVILLVIIGSLGSALYYLFQDRGRSPRTVKALTVRIGLSLGLFILLMLGFRFGLLHPHGINPDPRARQGAPSASTAPSQDAAATR